MITITPDKDGRVMRIGFRDEALPKGAVEVAEIPQEPALDDGKGADLYWNGEALEWRIYDVELPIEQPVEEEPPQPTREDIRALRAEAYKERVDPITSEISRLRDELKEAEDSLAESASTYAVKTYIVTLREQIADAEQRRKDAVARLKEEFPYPAEV